MHFRISGWLLGVVLRAYPAEFRVAHGDEIRQAMVSSLREARGAGRFAAWRVVVATIFDLLLNIAGARMDSWSKRRPGGGARMWALDLRHGFRRLGRQPVFSATVLLTLGLGVGVNAVLFGVVQRLLVEPLPYAEPDRLVRISNELTMRAGANGKVSARDVLDWRSGITGFDGVGALDRGSFVIADKGRAEVVDGYTVTADFFDVLGVGVSYGRAFVPEEGTPGRDAVVLLSHSYWAARYGSDPSVVGATIAVNERPRVIIGVLASGFEDVLSPLDRAASLYVPLVLDGSAGVDSRWLIGLARLRRGVTLEEAHRELALQRAALRQSDPSFYEDDLEVRLTPIAEATFGEIRIALGFALGAALAVLGIVCANLAGLTLARSLRRGKEMAVRSALGAGRGSLIRLVLAENAWLGAGGAAVGLLGAAITSSILTAEYGATFPRFREPLIDLRVLLLALVVSLTAALLVGLFPALRLSKMGPLVWLKNASGVGGDRGRRRAQRLFALAQLAASTALLFGAGLAIESYRKLASVETGFDPEGVTTFELRLPSARYGNDQDVTRFYNELTAALGALPGVVGVGAVDKRPLGTRWGCDAYLPRDVAVPATRNGWPCAEVNSATAGYFDAMGIRLLRGRGLPASDVAAREPIVVVSASLARERWPDEDPIGKSMKWAAEVGTTAPWRTVVGVVEDVRHVGLDRAVAPTIYVAFPQAPDPRMTVALRTRTDPASTAASVRAVVARMDDGIPVRDLRMMTEVVAQRLSTPRAASTFLGLMAAVALILALAGVYGVLSCSVSDRVREIGLRLALGESRFSLLRSIVNQGLRISLGALALGLLAAFFVGRALASQLYGVAPFEAEAVLGTVVLVLLVAVLSSVVPARRAAGMDPVASLKQE